MNCLKCNKETTNAKFCSLSCSTSYNNKLYPKKKRILQEMTLAEIRTREGITDRYVSGKNWDVRQLNRTQNKHLRLLPCANCGYEKHVELCHIKPISEFPLDTPLKIVNDESNIIQLCPNCHWEFDKGLLQLAR